MSEGGVHLKRQNQRQDNYNHKYHQLFAQNCQGFQAECYSVIQEQQEHIAKMEKTMERKDAIIQNLLAKCSGRNKMLRKNGMLREDGFGNIQQFELEVDKLNKQIEYLCHQNQGLRVELQEKQKYIALQQDSLQEKDRKLQEDGNILENLRQAYEAKIARILQDMKRKITNDVHSSMSKHKIQKPVYEVAENSIKTPIKISYFQKDCEPSTRFKTSETKNKNMINPLQINRDLQYRIQRFRAQTEQSQSSSEEEKSVFQNRFSRKIDASNIKPNCQKIGIKNILNQLKQKMDKFSCQQIEY